MKNRVHPRQGILLLGLLLGMAPGSAAQTRHADLAQVLDREWTLSGNRRADTRYYVLENVCTDIAEDGSRGVPTTYRLWMQVHARAAEDGKLSIRCLCRKATVTTGQEPPRRVPAFDDYEYDLHLGVDAGGQVFGIRHEDFSELVDDEGDSLGFLEGFMLYGSFIDFHMFDTFSAQGEGEFEADLGVLRRLGQREVCPVGVEVPIHLEPGVLEGSSFKNGTLSLLFKGVTLSNGVPCALIEVSSRDGSFELILAPQPGLEMRAIGGSAYSGDLYLELDSRWMNRLEFRELVVSKMTMGTQELGRSVAERSVTIRTVTRQAFQEE